MSLLMVGLLLLQTGVQYYHTFFTNVLGQSVIKDLRVNVFNHISSLKLKYFDRTPIGQLITRTVSDLETIADIFSEGLIVIVGDVLQVVAIIAVVFVGIFVDSNRASDVISYGVGAGALVVGLAIFAFATKKSGSKK